MCKLLPAILLENFRARALTREKARHFHLARPILERCERSLREVRGEVSVSESFYALGIDLSEPSNHIRPKLFSGGLLMNRRQRSCDIEHMAND